MRWAVTDHQGTVTDVIDSQGQVLNHLVYDSYGKVVSQSNPAVEFRYGYTGRELDTETGDYYYRARYYDANVGRFIGEDPLGFGAGDTNLTRYVFNSPTNYTDPSGEIAFIPIAVAVVVAYAAGQAFFPDYAQTPMSQCDNHPTPPDQELKRAGVEFITGLGVNAVPGAIKSFGNAAVAEARIAEQAAAAASKTNTEAIKPVGRIHSPMEVFPGSNISTSIEGREFSAHAVDRM